MRRFALVAAVALLLVVAALIAVGRVNSYLADNQAALATQIGEAIGRPVAFDALQVVFGLPPTARVANLRIAGDVVGGEDLLRAPTVEVSVDPLRALLGEIRIRSVTVDAPLITVTRRAAAAPPAGGDPVEGDPVEVEASTPPTPAEPSSPEHQPMPPPPSAPRSDSAPARKPGAQASTAVTVAHVAVRDGTIEYRDGPAAAPGLRALSRVDLDAYDLGPGRSARFSLQAALFDATTQNLSASGHATLRPGAPFEVRALADGIVIDQIRRLPDAAAWLPDDLASPDPIRVEVSAKGTSTEPDITLTSDAGAAALRFANWLDKPAGVPLTLRLDGRYADGRVVLRAAQLTLASLSASLQGSISRGDPPTVDLQLTAPSAALEPVAAVLPILAKRGAAGSVAIDLRASGAVTPTGIAAVSGRIDLQQVSLGSPDLPGRISNLSQPIVFEGDSAALADTIVTIGSTPVQIGCAAAPLADPSVTCRLNAATLPPSELGIDASADDVLRQLSIQASLRPSDPEPAIAITLDSDGEIQGVAFRGLQLQSRARHGEFRVEQASVQTLGGTIEASGTYHGPRHGTPRFDVSGTADGLRLEQLVDALGGEDASRYQGRVHATFALDGGGVDSDAVERSLRGSGRVDVRDGVVRDFDLDDEALGALAPLVSSRVRTRHPQLFGGDLRFTDASGSFTIADRKVATTDARVQSVDAGIAARGSVDFDSRLDLRGTMALSPGLTGDIFGGSAPVRDLSSATGGLDIGFTLRGTIDKPRLRLSGEAVANVIGRGIDTLVGGGSEGGKKVGELIQQGLDSLFKR